MTPFIRCIYCLSGQEKIVKELLEEAQLGQVLIPMKAKPLHKDRQWMEQMERLLPGYMFLYSEQENDYSRVKAIPGVIRILTYGNNVEDSYLKEKDLQFAQILLEKEGIIRPLEAIQEGDYVRITDELFCMLEGKVIGINRRRHMVNVEIQFLGEVRSIWLGYNVVEKLSKNTN